MRQIQICPNCGIIHHGEHDWECDIFELNPRLVEPKSGLKPYQVDQRHEWELMGCIRTGRRRRRSRSSGSYIG